MNKLNGFTLIELIVTMAIAAVVLSIAVPSYQTSIQNNRKTTSVNDLATAFQLARSTAITRRVTVTVCKSNSINDETPICRSGSGSGNDWSQGWVIFTNPNGDTVIDNDHDDEDDNTDIVLRVHGPLEGDVSFIGNNNVINKVSFLPTGLARGSNGRITYCDTREAPHASALIISLGGQVRNARDTDGNGTVDTGVDEEESTERVDVTCPASA